MARQITDVITQLVAVIPTTETHLLQQLEFIKRDVPYKAPETMGEMWYRLSMELQSNTPRIPTEDWHFQAMSIVSTKPEAELREAVRVYLETKQALG